MTLADLSLALCHGRQGELKSRAAPSDAFGPQAPTIAATPLQVVQSCPITFSDLAAKYFGFGRSFLHSKQEMPPIFRSIRDNYEES
jgi:hypothetical protein